MTHTQKLSWFERIEIAKIDEHGAPTEAEIKVDPRITIRLVHEARLDKLGHIDAVIGVPPFLRSWQARSIQLSPLKGSQMMRSGLNSPMFCGRLLRQL